MHATPTPPKGSITQPAHHPDAQFLHIRDGVEDATRCHDEGVLRQEGCLDDASAVVGGLEVRVLATCRGQCYTGVKPARSKGGALLNIQAQDHASP